MRYDVVLVFAPQHCEAAMCIHLSPPPCTSIHPQPPPPLWVTTERRAELLGRPAGSHSSVLHTWLCTLVGLSPSSSHLPFPHTTSTHLFSTSASLFLSCKQAHQQHLYRFHKCTLTNDIRFFSFWLSSSVCESLGPTMSAYAQWNITQPWKGRMLGHLFQHLKHTLLCTTGSLVLSNINILTISCGTMVLS